MKNSLRLYLITVVGVLVVSAVLFVFLYTMVDQNSRENVKTEALKVLMQLAAIGVVGGFVTWMLNERSKEKEREMARQQKRAERQDALNGFRRSAVARLVTATNVIRKAPILIESHRSKETYEEQIRAIFDARLDLSLLRHEQESFDVFTSSSEIRSEIQKMENYLNWIVAEWRDRYKDLPEVTAMKPFLLLSLRPSRDAWNEISNLPALADLRKGDEMSRFRREYLDGYREALRLMRADIFNPTDEDGQGLRPT